MSNKYKKNYTIETWLDLLYRSHTKFKKDIDHFRSTLLSSTKINIDEELEKIMNEFCIPDYYSSRLLVFIADFNGSFTHSKYTIAYNISGIKNPSIVITLMDEIGHKEWRDIWNRHLKPNKTKNKNVPRVNHLKREEKFIRRKWGNLDFYLKIYKMSKEGKSPIRISKEISDLRRAGEKMTKSNKSYDKEDIGKMLDKISEIIENL